MADITPATRIEKAISDATEITPATRIEKFIANISGADYELTPATRIEKLLDDAAGSSGSGEWTTDGIADNTEPNGDIILTIEHLPAYSLRDKTGITSVYAPNLLFIDVGAFTNCTGLTNIYIPVCNLKGSSVNYGSYTFLGCSSLKQVVLPSQTYSISYSTFKDCGSLEVIDFGPGMSSIDGSAVFENCYSLNKIILRSRSLVYLNRDLSFTNTPFYGYNGLNGVLYVPAALVEQYKTAGRWSTLYNTGSMMVESIEGSEYENYYADGTPVTQMR